MRFFTITVAATTAARGRKGQKEPPILRTSGERGDGILHFSDATSASFRSDSRSSTLGYSRRIALVSLRLFSSISGFRSASDPAGVQVLVARRRMLLATPDLLLQAATVAFHLNVLLGLSLSCSTPSPLPPSYFTG